MSRSREGEEVLERGKGGTADILSALGAVSDPSGLREQRRASVVPCDPRLCFMACSRSVSVWEKTERPEELCLCVYVCVYLHTHT